MKRTIDEIVTLYSLEPTTRRDVYAEGETDKDLIEWFFEQTKIFSRAVYSINLVDVPPELVERFGLNAGSNRSRVIGLAHAVWEQLDITTCTLQFVVDEDLCRFVARDMPPAGVLMTDHAAMESYLLVCGHPDRFTRHVCGVAACDHDSFMQGFCGVLQTLFALRVSLANLGIEARVVAADKLLEINGVKASLQVAEVVKRSLLVAKAIDRHPDVMNEIARVETVLSAAAHPLRFVHGHDLYMLLGEMVYALASDAGYRDEARIRSALLMGVSIDALAEEPLFAQLAK